MLKFNLNHTPEEAVAYLKSKGFQISFDWREVWGEQHEKVFTVAKAMTLDILEDIREAVETAMESGTTFEDFQQTLEPTLRAKGWWGKQTMTDPKTGLAKEVWAGTPWRLNTIYQTNLQTAYQCGRLQRFTRPSEKNIRPYWQYIAVMDSRTRPSHAGLHGKILRADDVFWQTNFPPNGFNCRCTVRTLSEKELASSGLKLITEDDGTVRNVSAPGTVSSGAALLKNGMKPDEGWAHPPCTSGLPEKDYADLKDTLGNDIFMGILASLAETLYD